MGISLNSSSRSTRFAEEPIVAPIGSSLDLAHPVIHLELTEPQHLPATFRFNIPRANATPLSATVTVYDPIAEAERQRHEEEMREQDLQMFLQKQEKEDRERDIRMLKAIGSIVLLFGTAIPAAAALGNTIYRVRNGLPFWGPFWGSA